MKLLRQQVAGLEGLSLKHTRMLTTLMLSTKVNTSNQFQLRLLVPPTPQRQLLHRAMLSLLHLIFKLSLNRHRPKHSKLNRLPSKPKLST
jgi:hypothetical protein